MHFLILFLVVCVYCTLQDFNYIDNIIFKLFSRISSFHFSILL